jgi:glycerophosphoryl diester phosphodiesterase
VRRASGGNLVVIHDQSPDGAYAHAVPRLRDVLDQFGSRCLLNLELKEKLLAVDVKQLILQAGCSRNVIISAFDSDDNDAGSSSNWEELQAFAPEIPIAILATGRKVVRVGVPDFIDAARRLGAVAVHPQRNAPIEELLPAAHSAGLTVHVWTVNEPEEIVRFRKMGVDAIFTDVPARARV